MESAQVWKEDQIRCHAAFALCVPSWLLPFSARQSQGELSAQLQRSAVGILKVVLHLSKQARPELALLGLSYRDAPALLLEAVCICQGCWLLAICAGPLLPQATLTPVSCCRRCAIPGHRRAES